MDRRFFVTVLAQDRQALMRLRDYGLDLFRHTAKAIDKRQVALVPSRTAAGKETFAATDKVTESREFVIEGLLSLEEIGRLVEAGYQVLVQEGQSKRSRAQTETVTFEEWLKGMEE